MRLFLDTFRTLKISKLYIYVMSFLQDDQTFMKNGYFWINIFILHN